MVELFSWGNSSHGGTLLMVVSSPGGLTGGNLHIHYQEEKCYDEEIFFYHLGCHQWVPSKILSQILPPHQGRQALGGGRYSHVAALMKDSVLLVAGGYSGFPRGDLLAFKVPISVYQTPVQD
ncbi:hypothetical protein FKM82_017331, partial [Ascaphus truei]